MDRQKLKDLIQEWGTLVKDDRSGSPREEREIEEQIKEACESVDAIASDAFDLGFKAAGGTMIPDGSRDVVELALTRRAIDALCSACAVGVGESRLTLDEEDEISKFLDTVSIYRSKK